MSLTIHQIRFCAAECERQEVGPMAVADMATAYDYLYDELPARHSITVLDIKIIGALVEPTLNAKGFRRIPVYFQDPTHQALPPDQIERSLDSLLRYCHDLSAEKRYIEFEKIHPFLDGNGRVGALLFNLWSGTMKLPFAPPQFVTA